jgi:hypothetical protein
LSVTLSVVRVILTGLAASEGGQLAQREAVITTEDARQGAEVFFVYMGHATARVAHQMMMWNFLFDLEEAPRGAQVRLSHQSQSDQEFQSAIHR